MRQIVALSLLLFLISCDKPKMIFDDKYYNNVSATLLADSLSINKFIYYNDTVNGWIDYKKTLPKNLNLSLVDSLNKRFKSKLYICDSVYSILDTIAISNNIGVLILEKHKPFLSYKKNTTLYLLILNSGLKLLRTYIVAKDFENNLGEIGYSQKIQSTLTKNDKLIICDKNDSWLDIGNPPYIMDSIVSHIDLKTNEIFKIDTIKTIKEKD